MIKQYPSFLFFVLSILFINACDMTSVIKQFKSGAGPDVSGPVRPQEEGMVFIPGGTFDMGSRYKKDESPVHRVVVDSFFLDLYEVTVAEYQWFCKATRRRMPTQPQWSSPQHPVVNVTWEDANAYARWSGKRLPTEAEWEYSARGSQPGVRYAKNKENLYGSSWGNIADESILRIKLRFPIKERYDDGFIYGAPVGSFPPNLFGLFDMEGNVLEWCGDWYDPGYYKNGPSQFPKGPDKGTYKMIRGASWNRSGAYLRSTYRSWYPKACAFEFLGFRCAKDYTRPTNTPRLVKKTN